MPIAGRIDSIAGGFRLLASSTRLLVDPVAGAEGRMPLESVSFLPSARPRRPFKTSLSLLSWPVSSSRLT